MPRARAGSAAAAYIAVDNLPASSTFLGPWRRCLSTLRWHMFLRGLSTLTSREPWRREMTKLALPCGISTPSSSGSRRPTSSLSHTLVARGVARQTIASATTCSTPSAADPPTRATSPSRRAGVLTRENGLVHRASNRRLSGTNIETIFAIGRRDRTGPPDAGRDNCRGALAGRTPSSGPGRPPVAYDYSCPSAVVSRSHWSLVTVGSDRSRGAGRWLARSTFIAVQTFCR